MSGSGCSKLRQTGSPVRSGSATTASNRSTSLSGPAGRLPAVNQIEWGPALFDRDCSTHHRRRSVQLEGYSPLNATKLRDPRLVEIAEEHGVTPAQVVLRWHIEHRIVAIPRSSNPDRIAENVAIFDFHLTQSEIERLDQLG